MKAQDLRGSAGRKMEEARLRQQQISRAQRELENLNSQAGQQQAKLLRLSEETAAAWEWVQANQDAFEHPVYGPPVLTCSVRDPRYADALESLLQKNDFCAFTTQSRADFTKLGRQLYQTMGLAEISIRTSSAPLADFRAPVSDAERQRLGFDGWAIDFLQGPEPVLAMLCAERWLHQTGVTLRDLSEQQFEVLRNSPVSSWASARHTYQITRRREYGPDATSTRVRDIRRGQVWTAQPVDMGLQSELRANISTWAREMQEFQHDAGQVNEQIKGLRAEAQTLDKERVSRLLFLFFFSFSRSLLHSSFVYGFHSHSTGGVWMHEEG
jgi:hypothetical protein